MKLVFGLGNIGAAYADTYHNVGFFAVDRLAERIGAPAFSVKKNAEVADCVYAGGRVMLLKPTTYMNLSGDAVGYFSRYYKVEPKDILVIYDDIDIKKGVVRARPNGSAGTHNGMRDIVLKLGSQDFPRVRIGTGIRPPYMDLKDYVMMKMPQQERELMTASADAACDFAEAWLRGEPWQDMTVTVQA